ncbi:unnamed protein product [Arctia plantaginis]|uniref:Nuclease HARBI1 n=1 Tax=Arctia plantaginis TaxID=874455 RepID=A0A8S1B0P6_ARCPL|nr:unnamed protein product [Arctia plantaginis]
MTNKLTLFEFLECDIDDISSRKKCRRDLREDTDPLIAFEDEEFIKRYRLSKQLVLDLCEELGPMFRKPVRSTYLSVEIKILTALSFYGTGSYRRPIGDISAHSMAQQTVSSVIAEVTACIDSPNMRRKYIHFPQTPEERNKTRARANIPVPALSNEDMLREAQMQIAALDPDAVHTDNEALHQGVSTRSSLIRRLWSSVLS